VLSVALFGYDDVLGERVLEEYEADRARWAPSAEKLRRETVASILAGPAPREALQASRRQRDALGQRRGPRAREFVYRELGPLDADGDAMAAAAGDARGLLPRGRRDRGHRTRLGVHINTISYRLRQCEELLERPVKQRRFEFEAAPPEER